MALLTACVALLVAAQSPVTDQEREIWARAVRPYITQPTWDDGRNYTVGHTMMVPLHAAFLLNEQPWIDEWAEYIRRFWTDGKPKYDSWTTGDSARQRRIQYLYLISRYLVLAAQTKRESLIPPGLGDWLSEAVDDIWNRGQMRSYTSQRFNSMKEMMQWKLNSGRQSKSYFNAIVDEERFLQGIAADLRAYERMTGRKLKGTKALDSVLEFALLTYKQRVKYTSGDAWVFQPGAWEDHPDYAYAGVDEVTDSMSPRGRHDIAEDSSHSHRTALWLVSLEQAYAPGTEERKYYAKLRSGLARQFVNKVLVMPSEEFDGVRLRNYLDGSNGVYRWEYKNLGGAGRGYRPYGLSFVFMLGWWTFLDVDKVREAYAVQATKFPLSDRLLMTYYAELTDDEKKALLDRPATRNTQRLQWQICTSLASKLRLSV